MSKAKFIKYGSTEQDGTGRWIINDISRVEEYVIGSLEDDPAYILYALKNVSYINDNVYLEEDAKKGDIIVDVEGDSKQVFIVESVSRKPLCEVRVIE